MNGNMKIQLSLVILILGTVATMAVIWGGTARDVTANSDELSGLEAKYLTQAEADARFDSLEAGQERIYHKLDSMGD